MKKLLIAILFPFALKAQDTTNVTLTDSARMYRYSGVYAVIDRIEIQPPYRSNAILRFNNDSATIGKWLTRITVKVYNSKADYLAGRGELFVRYPQELYTDKVSTQREIFERMRTVIK